MSAPLEIGACPACASEVAAEIASGEELRREHEELWEFHVRRLRPGVPIQHLFDRTIFSQDPPLRLARCAECDTIFRNPREREGALVHLYADEEPDPVALAAIYEAQRADYRAQAMRLTEVAGPGGTGLEVGSYVGGFLAAAAEHGWRVSGLDINPVAVEFARARGLTAHEGSLDSLPDLGRTFDAIALWNCFDQLPDPRKALRTARHVVRPGGSLAIRVPNGAFYARWRARLGLRPARPVARLLLAHNNLLGFPYRHGFTPGSLSTLLQDEGFEVVRVFGDTLVRIADRWTRRWAAAEERLVKRAIRGAARDPDRMPWFEVYARLP